MTAQETLGANFFETTLTAQMAPTDLTANVAATTGMAIPCYAVIEPDVPSRREVILFDSSMTATTFVASNISKRYLTGSAAGSGITHPINSVVRYSVVMQLFTDLNDRVDAKLNTADHDTRDHSSAMSTVVLDDISDVAASAPVSGDALVWNGSTWAPGASGDILAVQVFT